MLGFTPEKPPGTTEEKQDEHKVDCRGASRVAEPEHMPTCVRTRAGQENDKKRVNGDTRNRDPYVTRLESRRLMSLHNDLLVNGRSCERTRTSHTATNLDVNHTRGSGRDRRWEHDKRGRYEKGRSGRGPGRETSEDESREP